MISALMIAVCCVLFIHMGLYDELEKITGHRFKIISCTKCLVFWSCLLYMIITGNGIVKSVFTGFGLSYISLWLELLLSKLGVVYENLYSEIYSETDKKCTEKTGEVSEM